jgi:outer membrane protein assembly factor BamB
MRSATRYLLPILLLLVTGCGSKYRLHRDDLAVPSPWPYHRGEAASLGADTSAGFTGRLTVLWERSLSEKASGPLTIHHNTLVYPSTKNRIRFYDPASGAYLGRLKSKGVPLAVTGSDSTAVYSLSARRNRLVGKNLLNGKTIWKRSVKDALLGPIIGNSSLLVSAANGTVAAIDIANGDIKWQYEAAGRLVAPASVADGQVFQPCDDGTLYVLSAEDGSELYKTRLEGPLVGAVAVGKLAYVADILGHVYAVDIAKGEIRWQRELSGPIWTAPAAAGDRIVVGHSGGQLVALESATGVRKWLFDIEEVIKAPPLIAGDYVVVGTAAGSLVVVDLEDGSEVDRLKLKGALDVSPITDGRHLLAATSKGRLVCFAEERGNDSKDD